MVLTVTLEKEWREDKVAHAILKITFDNSYLTGGESLDLSAYMKNISFIEGISTEDEVGYELAYDDTDFATAVALVLLLWGNNDQGADGPLIDCGSTEDCSGVSARIHAFGDAY